MFVEAMEELEPRPRAERQLKLVTQVTNLPIHFYNCAFGDSEYLFKNVLI